MEKDILKQNRIPGCDKLTRPEEISALSKYLGKIKKTQEEHTTLDKDVMEVPGRTTGKVPEIDSLVSYREGLDIDNSISELPGESSVIRIDHPNTNEPDALPTDRLNISDIPDIELPDKREDLMEQEKLTTLPDDSEFLDVQGGNIDRLSEIREELNILPDLEILPGSSEALDVPDKVTELSGAKEELDVLGDIISDLTDKREFLAGEIKEPDLSEEIEKISGDLKETKKLSGYRESLEGIEDITISKLPGNKINISGDVPEISELSGERSALEVHNNLEELSKGSEILDVPDKVKDLYPHRENLDKESIPEPELETSRTGLKVSDNINKLSDTREDLTDVQGEQELSEVIASVPGTSKSEEIVLSDYLGKLEVSGDEVKSLSGDLEKIEPREEVDLSDYLEGLEISFDDVVLPESTLNIPDIEDEEELVLPEESIKVGGNILETTKLEDYCEDLVTVPDLSELPGDKEELGVIDNITGLSGTRIDITPPKDQELEMGIQDLPGEGKDIQELSEIREELTGNVVDPELGTSRVTLKVDSGVEDLDSERLEMAGTVPEPSLSEVLISRGGEEEEPNLSGTSITLTDVIQGTENLETTRLDITVAPEPDLSDYIDSLTDDSEDSGLSNYISKVPGKEVEILELPENILQKPGDGVEVTELSKDVLLRPGTEEDPELPTTTVPLGETPEIIERPENVLMPEGDGGPGYKNFQDNLKHKLANKEDGYYKDVLSAPEAKKPLGDDRYFYSQFEDINDKAGNTDTPFDEMYKGKQPEKVKAKGPEVQNKEYEYSYEDFLKTLDIDDPEEASPEMLYNRALMKLENFGEVGKKIQPIMSSYLSGVEDGTKGIISPKAADEYRKKLEESILPFLIIDKGTGGNTQTVHDKDERKTQSRTSGMPKYQLPKFNIGMLNINSYIRWAAESTVGAIDYGKVGEKAQKYLGLNLRETLIKETIDALIFARDLAERETKSNRDRLPGDDMGALGDLVSGGVSGALGNMKKAAYDTVVSAITGTEIVPPLNRPSTKRAGGGLKGFLTNDRKPVPTEGWTPANNRTSMSEPGAAETSDKGFMKKLGEGLKDMAIGNLGDKGGDRSYKFQDNYLKGEGMKLTLEGLCERKSSSSINSVEDLFETLRQSPYCTTPEKFTTTQYNKGTVQTLDSNAYWEIVFKPYTGDLNGNSSYLPAIGEINTRNMAYHGVTTAYNKWIPFVSFDLQKTKMTSKTLGLYDGEITYPVSMEFINELRMTIADDQFKSWRTYFETCMEVAAYNSEPHDADYYSNYTSKDGLTIVDKNYPLVAFYKNLVFQCDIYVMTPQHSTIRKFSLLLVLKDFSQEYSGEIDSGGTDLNVAFSIVGELGYMTEITKGTRNDIYVKTAKPVKDPTLTAIATQPPPSPSTLPPATLPPLKF